MIIFSYHKNGDLVFSKNNQVFKISQTGNRKYTLRQETEGKLRKEYKNLSLELAMKKIKMEFEKNA